jgi:hypothetical protein
MHPAKTRRLAVAIGAALPFVLYSSSPVDLHAQGTVSAAQTTQITVKLIEWDLPEQMDNTPGGMAVDVQGDGNRIWFTTRVAQFDAPRLYQFDLRGGKKVNNGQWVSYELDPNSSGVANGLRKIRTSKDKRFVFVHTAGSLQRIDTLDCNKAAGTTDPLIINGDCGRTTWLHDMAKQADGTFDPNGPTNPDSGSDVAIDDYNNVFTVSGALLPDLSIPGPGLPLPDSLTSPAPVAEPGTSFVQRLSPSPDNTLSKVIRWYVGHNVGICSSSSGPCLSGITYDKRRDKIYFSEPGDGADDFGAIAELDMARSAVRRWDFAALSVTGDVVREPRQLNIDNDGKLWTVTGSGHLVSLDPGKNRMSKHKTPIFAPGDLADLFGVAPDSGLIGYTDSSLTTSKVGMLAPDKDFVPVSPKTTYVPSRSLTIPAMGARANRTSGSTPPQSKTVFGQRVNNSDGQFTEAVTNSNGNDSFMPLGITPDMSASVGTFFYAVGDPNSVMFNRIGRVRLPRAKEKARIERDDDDNDDDGKRNDVDDDVDDDGVKNAMDNDSDNDGTPDSMDDDDDNDGIEDSFDTKDHKETKQSSQQDLAAGQPAQDAFTVNPGTLLVVLSAVSTDVLAPVTIEVVDATGQVVASSLASPGAAALTWIPPAAGGDYTLRVKNQSIGASTISTKILTRENWPLIGGLF